METRKFLPMAYHPRNRVQLEADGLIPKTSAKAAVAAVSTDTKIARKKIIEEKPKKKVVKEYFRAKIEQKHEGSSDED